MQQLDAHRNDSRRPVQKEQEAPAARVLHCVFDEVDDRIAPELVQTAKTEVSCSQSTLMLNQ